MGDMDELTQAETWPALCSFFTGSTPHLRFLEILLNTGRFPSLARSSHSQPLSDDELQKSKAIFNSLIYRLSHLHSLGGVPSIRFCRDVEHLVRGNVTLFEPTAFGTLLDSILTVEVAQSSTELRQNLSAGLASLLYLYPVNYKTFNGTTATTVEPSKTVASYSNPDFLDFQRGERCLDLLTSLLEVTQEDTKTGLSCFHALVQLLCHRKLFHPTQLTPSKLDRLVRVVQFIWPVAFCISNRQPRREEGSTPISSSSSVCPSSSGGDISDAGGMEICAVRELKKSRLLATFCLRRLLTSKRICSEAWTSTGIRSFQSDLLEALCRERDARLRELFIVILGVVLDKLTLRFAVAEEPSNWQPATFIPYSLRVANELRTLHRSLIWALRTEQSFRHQLALLKVLAVLITVTPYNRLHPGLLLNVVTNLNSFHNRTRCIAPILPVWNAILAKTPTSEVQRLLTSPTPTLRLLSLCDTSSMSPNPCWLVLLCLQLVDSGGRLMENEKGTQPTVLRSQAISTLTAFIPLHYNCLVPSMEEIKRMIEIGFRSDREENRSLRIPLLRFCDALLTHIFECLEEEKALPCPPLDYDWWLGTSGILINNASSPKYSLGSVPPFRRCTLEQEPLFNNLFIDVTYMSIVEQPYR
ncbi:HEAT repeat-containing protein 6 [Echinococcus granulosus]|uniref:HEAT repeat-containing protein 6 n=1 Tax=Echinococcus granulosus TaxID=6210 RepID=W6U7D0_ECHGR|nr:HEAT repeat-containing protein 6 [Echinococcus granulosus]EUB57085.1 HEAT repeat-containing protein 6 [Echinococcus granulosus]